MQSVSLRISRWLCLLALPLATAAHATCTLTPTYGVKLAGDAASASPSALPSWDAGQTYQAASKVQWNGFEYQSRWWTQGEPPGSDRGEVWQLLPGPGGIPQPWQSAQVYYAGEQTAYQGNAYSAKWWTKGAVPDREGSGWSFARVLDPFAGVQLQGSYHLYNCAVVSNGGYVTDTYLTISWSIAQDANQAVAYWKQMDDRTGVEIMRGAQREGTLTASHGQDCRPVPGGTAACRDTGQSVSMYLCNASNICRRIMENTAVILSNPF